MKIGIDLSSTNTGLVILSDDNRLIWHGNFKLWDNSSQKPNRVFVRELFDIINLKRLNKLEKITIGVELSDFGNWKYADRFNFIAGALYQEHFYYVWGSMSDFVCFNSNEWQRFLIVNYKDYIITQTFIIKNKKVIKYQINNLCWMCDRHKINQNWLDKRQLLKELSRMWSAYACVEYKDAWTEDECDAYCIAYFLEKLRDRTQMHQEVKERTIKAKKSKLAEKNEQIRKLKKVAKLNKIIARYDKCMAEGKKLTKSQINAQEKAIKELEEINNGNKQNI